MSISHIIFDCDGVLVDSERLAVRVEARLITELGWPIDEDDVLDRPLAVGGPHALSLRAGPCRDHPRAAP